MLTRMRIKNFKSLHDVEIDLGQSVVFIGPNNSGKTTALQALSLWNTGLKRWYEKRGENGASKRKGVSINRKDLFAMSVPAANLLWRDLHTRNMSRTRGKLETANVRIEILVEGISAGNVWQCGLEFDYANPEALYCRPLRAHENDPESSLLPVPEEAIVKQVAFLPPMSGLSANEYLKHQGEIEVRIGEGQTAEVLRNLCYKIWEPEKENISEGKWHVVVEKIRALFGITLCPPELKVERSELSLRYKDARGIELDICSAGRGLQQTLLLLTYMYGNPDSILLIDEPDAHLEVLRQRQTYKLIAETATAQRSQVICASHSEVVLNEAAGRDTVVAFVGRPHRIDNRGSQVLKALTAIGFEHYCLAEQTGWVLYLEGATDLSILQEFAQKLRHPVANDLERPFVHYIANDIGKARDHFFGLREAYPALSGAILMDRPDRDIHEYPPLQTMFWKRREIENYFCTRDVLLAYAQGETGDDLFAQAEGEHRIQSMNECIVEMEHALRTMHAPSPWSAEIKATGDFLDPLFENYFEKIGTPHQLRKGKYYELAALMPAEELDPEIAEKLDRVYEIARTAKRCE